MKEFASGLILAGGKSSRMGFDKQFLEIENKRLMDMLISSLELEFSEIIIVTNRPETYRAYKNKIIQDIIPGKGPLSGIHAGLKEASSKYVFVLACDMPRINLDYIGHMKRIILERKVDVCLARRDQGLEPFNGFYSKKIIGEIEDYLESGRRSVSHLISNLNAYYVEGAELEKFNRPRDMFSNLNTRQDLEAYLLEGEGIEK